MTVPHTIPDVEGGDRDEREMISEVADSVRRGLEEAVAYARSEADEACYRVYVPAAVNVRAVRAHRGRHAAKGDRQ